MVGQQGARHKRLQLMHVIHNLENAILIENEKREIELVNQAFCEMFNIPVKPSAMVGQDCSQMAAQNQHLFVEPQAFVDRIDKILVAQKTVRGDVLYLVDGRVLERDYTPFIVDGQYQGHFWNYRDVTGQVNAIRRQDRLNQIEIQQQQILRDFLLSDHIDDVLNRALAQVGTVLDVDRAYVFHFRSNERLLDNTYEWCGAGVNPEIDNLQGLPFDELVPSFFPMLAEKGIIQATDIQTLPEDIYNILAPQQIRSVLIVPIYHDERIEGFIGFDEIRQPRIWLPEEIATARIVAENYARLLERQQARYELEKARDRAVQSAKVKSEFMSNMSHEIRTPMTGLIGMLELLGETQLDEDQREFVTDAYDSAHRLYNIVNDILDFSKIEAGRVTLETETVHIKDLLMEVKTTLATAATRNGNTVRIDVAENVPNRIIGDTTRLRQILMNLTSNAVKFTKGGFIVLRVRQLGRSTKESRLRFEVIDTGIGMQPEQVERVFGSFTQADGSITRKYGGTGLGLAISKQLVELMGGTIDVRSVAGQGSTFGFTLTFPYAVTALLKESDIPQLHTLNVLVFDNEPTGRYVLSQQIRTLGVNVVEVEQFAELPQKLRNAAQQARRFDVFLIRIKASSDLTSTNLKELREAVGLGFKRLIGVFDDAHAVPMFRPFLDEVMLYPLRQSDLYNLLIESLEIEEAPEATRQTTPDGNACRILLAEDHLLNQKMVRKALRSTAYQLDIVSDGQAALDQLQRQDYNLVMLDIQMPVMDGLQALKHIRNATAPFANVPVIALTASVLTEEIETYLASGFNAVVTKPFSLDYLRKVVAEYVTPSRCLTVD